MSKTQQYDLIIAGAGILGAASAWQYLQRRPGSKVLVIDKESQPASHQTGRNSGVVHAGVYYPPGSLKARYCREGLEQTKAFCQQENIAWLQCGKLIVATDSCETSGLEALFLRSHENGLAPQWLDGNELKKREPAVRGEAAIFIKETAITDYPVITRSMLTKFENAGGCIQFNREVNEITEREGNILVTCADGQSVAATQFLNCAGLMADRLIAMQGLKTDFRILPFRGEYYQLPEKYNQIVNRLIYPVPDPQLPFLGVHLTRMIDGSVTAGPNAVLALAREGYSWSDVNLKDCWDSFTYKGFWPLAKRFWRSGFNEFQQSLRKSEYLKRVQKYCPQIQLEDLQPYRHGVRAQAVTESGELLHDFRFVQTPNTLHVGNAPSPAATSAIPIAKAVVEKLLG